MTSRVASAPGKVVVAGEYAVLHGAPAIAMAVNCRARVTVSPGAGQTSALTTRGYQDGRRQFALRDDCPVWQEQLALADRPELFDVILAEAGPPGPGSLEFVIDSSAFRDRVTGNKYGLGSSAAVAVALTAVCLGPDSTSMAGVAHQAHRRFQRGAGSGIDIATSVHGGVIQFQQNADVVRLEWPDGLFASIFWSGSSASTGEKIKGLDSADESRAASELVDASRHVCNAWQDGNAAQVLAALQHFVNSLASYDDSKGRGIFDAGHGELVDLAQAHAGLVYKPCGAGGGDIGMALSDSRRSLAEFAQDAEARGFLSLDASLDSEGLRFEGNSA